MATYKNQTVTVWEWFVFSIVTGIPGIGLLASLAWAFHKDTKPSKANMARLQLIVAAFFTLITAIVYAIMLWNGVTIQDVMSAMAKAGQPPSGR